MSINISGLGSLLAIVQMPPGIPVATFAVNGAQNTGILAVRVMALSDSELANKLVGFKENLKRKIEKANNELAEIKFRFKTN